ncbi:hypothetical protein D046_2560C, partial [Vibrio parahaemolyticus V-223/04]
CMKLGMRTSRIKASLCWGKKKMPLTISPLFY